MKKLTVLIVMLAAVLSFSMAQDYSMYETQYLKVHPGKTSELLEALAAHNKKFHSSGPYTANVWSVYTGPYSGQLVWAMGPCTFTDLDKRPSGDDHDKDWEDNVTSQAEVGLSEYWRLSPSLSHAPDSDSHKIIRVRILNIKASEGYRFRALVEKMKEVWTKKNYPFRTNVYRNRMWSRDGRDWAFVTAFDKWADLDRDNTFSDDYEEIHGSGSWRLFLEEWEEVVVNAEDEMRELIQN